MEVSNMLCVGRGRLSQFGKTHTSEIGFHTPERKSSTEMNSGERLTEKELVARVSSKLTQDSLSPPTKSILRGRLPSPKQGSPSSLRSVRFSDKGGDDEIMYAKIHVNKNVQTEHVMKEKTHKEMSSEQGFKLNLAQNHEEFNPKPVYELKTSTPRYSKFEDTPSLDFHTPRGHQEGRKSSQKSQSPDKVAPQSKSNTVLTENVQNVNNKHERIVFDIEIDRKRSAATRQDTSELKSTGNTQIQGRKPASRVPDTGRGNRIVQNMGINRSRSKSPERKRPVIPDGNRIIQNLELSCGDVEKLRSTASQTSCSDTSSPRSASPETPYENKDIPDGKKIIKNMEITSTDSSRTGKSIQRIQIPDGEKIIQNLEFNSRDSSFRTRSESSQTADVPDGSKITQNMELTNARSTSIGIQAFDENDIEEESTRSVPVQTDFSESEDSSPNDSVDLSNSRSIAVQTQPVNGPTIPDGSKITRNMDIHKPEKTKQFIDSRDDKKTLNDSNWNEFVRHLELFNPSQSSSSSVSVSEEEIPTSQNAEPILVYDRNAPSPETVRNIPTNSHGGNPMKTQQVSERSAGTFLKSEAYTKRQYESVLQEEGLLSKYDINLKSKEDPSVSAKLLVEQAFSKNKDNFKGTKINTKEPNTESSKKTSEYLRSQQVLQPRQFPVSTYCKESNTGTGVTSGLNISEIHTKSYKEHLGFTPIETYSFNPETLMKTASKRACSSSKPIAESLKTRIDTTTPRTSISPTIGTKESVTKNSFIQGLDLGPAPRSLSPQRNRTQLSTNIMSDTRSTGFRRDDSKYCSTFSSKYDKIYGSEFPERPKYRENVSTLSFGNSRSAATTTLSSQSSSLSGFQKSDYSHVTGHQPRTSSSSYRFSVSQNRPSSAPTTRSKLYTSSTPLSSTLKEMRNNALRKNAMHQFSDLKRRSPALVKPSSFSATTINTRIENQSASYLKSSKFSVNGYTRSQENSIQSQLRSTSAHVSSSLPSRSAYVSKERSISPRRASPQRSDYMYLSALNDQSNARPSSRDRSRSRSRSPTRSSAAGFCERQYEALRDSSQRINTQSIMHSPIRNHGKPKSFTEMNEDRGNFDSVVSSGYQRSHVTTSGNNVDHTSSRESRPLTRKPPLPTTRRSLSNGRSRSRSADSLSRESTKQANDVTTKKQPNNAANNRTPGPVKETKPKLSKHTRVNNASELETVTIGNVPSGLADPGCMFLGHDTIQKIIEEARL